MDKAIKLSTEYHGTSSTNVEIDNTTNFLEFNATNVVDNKALKKAAILLSFEEGKRVIDINGLVLRGMEANLLIEFLTQNPQ